MKEKLKIAVYSGDLPSTTFIERLIKGLAKEGKSIYLFGFLKKPLSYQDSIKVVAYKQNRFSKAIHFIRYSLLLFFFKPKEKTKLDKLLKTQSKQDLYSKVKYYPVLWHSPDIFHVQWAKGLEDWMWVQEFGIKLVLSLRGAHINYSPIADTSLANNYKQNFPKVDGFHAVSKAIAEEASKYGASNHKIRVIYSGLTNSLFQEPSQKASPVFKILSIGRPHWKKGYAYALDACKILKDHNLIFSYTIIGGASDIELLYQVKDLGLESEVVLLDQLGFNEVQEHIKSSNLVLLPSVEEGIANVVLEAMALGTLVLTTNCGGMTEVVTDGENGFVVPIRDAEKMAIKIQQIMKLESQDMNTITKKGQETVRKQHSEKQMISGMLELYESVMKEE